LWVIYNILCVWRIFLLLLICIAVFRPHILHFDNLNLKFFTALLSIIHFIYRVFLLHLYLLFFVTKTWRKSLFFYYIKLFFVIFAILFSSDIFSLIFDCVFFIAFAVWTLKRVCFQVSQIDFLYFDDFKCRTPWSFMFLLFFSFIRCHFITFGRHICAFNIRFLDIRQKLCYKFINLLFMCHRGNELFATTIFYDSLILLKIVLILTLFVDKGLLCFIRRLDEMIFMISCGISKFWLALDRFLCCIITCKMVRQGEFLMILECSLFFML